MNANIASPDQTNDRGVFLVLLALYSLVLYPILRANRYYNDDLKRALIGHTGWDATGRPLTNLLMKLLQCYDSALVDISPLTQIAAIAVLAWTGVLIARRYAIGSPWMAALVAFPLGGQPFYLENLSYKFDALSMSLAVLLALLPIISLDNTRRGWWLGVLALFGSLNFYQPAINAYLIFILLDLVLAQLHERRPREWLTQLRSRALQVGASMLIYQFTVGAHVNGWVKKGSEKIHSLDELPLVKTNFVNFYTFIGDSFNRQWQIYFIPVLILLSLFPVAIGIRYALKTHRTQPVGVRAILIGTSFLPPLAALAFVLGPMLFLLKPVIAPRVLIGAGALLAASLITMQAALEKWNRSENWTLSASCMLALGMCSIASAYGNALGEQKSYEDRIATRLADDFSDLATGHPNPSLLLDGSAGYSPVTAHVAEQFPLVRSLIAPYIAAGDTFHTHTFLLYYIPDFVDMQLKSDEESLNLSSAILAQTCRIGAARTTSAYRLYMVGSTVVARFRSGDPQRCDPGEPPVDIPKSTAPPSP